jgi:hypothetical protein
MEFDSNSHQVQQCLSEILENPASNLEIRTLFPDRTGTEQTDILHGVNRAIEKVLEISLQSEGRPTLIYRLRFCWIVLRKADYLVKRQGRKIIPEKQPPYNMNDIRNIFQGILDSEELHDCFLTQLCKSLSLEPDGRFVRDYYNFLNSTKPRQLNLSLINGDRTIITKNLSRIIWWIIRKNKYRYVEIVEGGLRIHFTFLADDVREEIPKWCDRESVNNISNLVEEIENQINWWLKYSCIEGEKTPIDEHEHHEIARYFIKENDLKHRYKEKIADSSKLSTEHKKILEREKELLHFAQEVEKLEEEKRKLGDENTQLRSRLKILEKEKQAMGEAQINADVSGTQFQDLQKENIRLRSLLETLEKEKEKTVGLVEDRNNVAIMGLQDFFKNVDSKYSFDVLRSVQLGEDHSVSTKNFVDHLFYSLRRKGFAAYPITEEFDLEYDQCGLYQCVGFEVPPGGKVHVKVEKRGWAFIKGIRIFPVRKAILKLA